MMFFVLNVGRSGSRTVAQVLSQSPNCTCLHEPEPQLVEEAHQYRTGDLDPSRVTHLLRTTRHEEEGLVYGETANRLALVIPPLQTAFPDAQLVWLVRDGRAMVSSAVQRGWYAPGEDPESKWARYRPTAPILDGLDPSVWDAWDQFERVCWYWARVNQLIRDDTRGSDVMTLRLEDLTTQVDQVASHVGITPTAFTVTHANRRFTADEEKPADAKRSNLVAQRFEFAQWTDEQREVFERHCAPLMDELYAGWRHVPPDGWHASAPQQSTERVLISLREEMAEFRLTRRELQGLREDRDDLQQRLIHAESENRQLTTEVRDVTDRLAIAERDADEERSLRASLAAELAATHRRQLELDRRVDDLNQAIVERDDLVAALKSKVVGLEDRLAAEREQRRRLTSSKAYRFARLLDRIRRRAVRVVLTVLRAVFRSVPRAIQGRVRDWVDVWKARRRGTPSPLIDVPRLMDVPGRSGATGLDVPVIALLLWDTCADDVRRAVREVRTLQTEVGDFGPLFVTDATSFHVFREHGMLFEYVPPREEWTAHFAATPYEEFVSHRLARLTDAYHPDQVVTLDLGDRHRASSLATLRGCVTEQTERRARLAAAVASSSGT